MRYKHWISLGISWLMVASATLKAQSTHDEWTQQMGGTGSDHANAIAVDAYGNTYITGGFQGTSAFGKQLLHANGDGDIFIAKYNSSGELVWVVNEGSNAVLENSFSEYGTDIVVQDNFLYVTGVFLSKARFDKTDVSSKGRDDIFLAKYTLDGKLLWVQQAGGESQDLPYSLTVDKTGNAYLTGSFQKTAFFGSHQLQALNATEMFVAKYTPAGQVEWVRQTRSQQASVGKVVRCTDTYCVIAGEFEKSLEWAGKNLQTPSEGIFISTISLSGDILDVAQINGSAQITVEDMLLNGKDIYLTGGFTDRIQASGKSVYSSGNWDGYLLKAATNGTIAFLDAFGGPSMDSGHRLVLTATQELIVAGKYQEHFQIQSVHFNGYGGDDMCVLHFSTTGTFLTGKTFGGAQQDQIKDIAGKGEHLFLTGIFRDALTVHNQTYQTQGYADIVLNKIKLESSSETNRVLQLEHLYPNPCKDFFYVPSDKKVTAIKIYDLTGKLVFEAEKERSSLSKVMLPYIQNGLYLVKLVTPAQTLEYKLVINP